MTVASEIATCPECREIVDTWWKHGLADDRSGLRTDELAFYEHLVKYHPTIALKGRDGCRDCRGAVAMAQFALPGTDIYLKDGTWVNPARLHFVHHFLEQTADLDQATLTSGHAFTVRLSHRAGSPDLGHDHHVTLELTAPALRVTDDQTVALKTVVAELERDLQFRELERLGDGGLATLNDLARWLHRTVADRLADGLGDCLKVRVEAPGIGPDAVFPPPQ
ncbi:hypothetical protein [Streptomyces sp. YKOK-I1]